MENNVELLHKKFTCLDLQHPFTRILYVISSMFDLIDSLTHSISLLHFFSSFSFLFYKTYWAIDNPISRFNLHQTSILFFNGKIVKHQYQQVSSVISTMYLYFLENIKHSDVAKIVITTSTQKPSQKVFSFIKKKK